MSVHLSILVIEFLHWPLHSYSHFLTVLCLSTAWNRQHHFKVWARIDCGLKLYRDVLLLFPGQEHSALIHKLIFTTHECPHTLHHLFSTITKSSIAINSTRDWIPLKEAWDWSLCMWGEQRGPGWRKRKFIKVSTFHWGWNHFQLLGRWLCLVQFSRPYCIKEIMLVSVGEWSKGMFFYSVRLFQPALITGFMIHHCAI